MENEVTAPTTLRDTLEASFDAVEQPNDPPKVETERPRDEQGKFAAKSEPAAPVAEPQVPTEPAPRPNTWKREFLPLWDKLYKGVPLTPEESRQVAEYSGLQREREFEHGVSTYRAEAQNSKQLQAAIEPFLPELQKHNIDPKEWIGNLGRAHETLALGSPEQKLQMFAQLANDYGVPLNAIGQAQQGQLDPIVTQLMSQIEQLKGSVNTVTSWREQQEQATLQAQLAPFQDTAKYPHFEQVRSDMALLLESGKAKDLESAYNKAVRMNDEVWEAEQERQALAKQNDPIAAAAKAKAHAVQTKSSTPKGLVKTGAKDRLSVLSAAFDAVEGGRV